MRPPEEVGGLLELNQISQGISLCAFWAQGTSQRAQHLASLEARVSPIFAVGASSLGLIRLDFTAFVGSLFSCGQCDTLANMISVLGEFAINSTCFLRT